MSNWSSVKDGLTEKSEQFASHIIFGEYRPKNHENKLRYKETCECNWTGQWNFGINTIRRSGNTILHAWSHFNLLPVLVIIQVARQQILALERKLKHLSNKRLFVTPLLVFALKELSIINPYTNNRTQEATACWGLQVCGRVQIIVCFIL